MNEFEFHISPVCSASRQLCANDHRTPAVQSGREVVGRAICSSPTRSAAEVLDRYSERAIRFRSVKETAALSAELRGLAGRVAFGKRDPTASTSGGTGKAPPNCWSGNSGAGGPAVTSGAGSAHNQVDPSEEALLDATQPATQRSVFTVDGTDYTWDDVVAYARARGDWRELERTTRHGLACVRRFETSGDELSETELAAAEAAFRYARNLLAAEDTHAWLEAWGLSIGAWRAYLRRALLRERWPGESDALTQRFPPTEEEVEKAIWAEAVCSGFLAERASRLAGDLAFAVQLGESLAAEREAVFARAASAAERARAEAVTEGAVEREVANHGLEWLHIDGTLLELPSEDLAREAALCVRDDGRPFEEVAADCGVQPRPLSVYVADAEPDVAAALVAAREGELVGPLVRNGAYVLMEIKTKTPPATSDAEIRRKAEERLVVRELRRAVAANVKWHAHH